MPLWRAKMSSLEGWSLLLYIILFWWSPSRLQKGRWTCVDTALCIWNVLGVVHPGVENCGHMLHSLLPFGAHSLFCLQTGLTLQINYLHSYWIQCTLHSNTVNYKWAIACLERELYCLRLKCAYTKAVWRVNFTLSSYYWNCFPPLETLLLLICLVWISLVEAVMCSRVETRVEQICPWSWSDILHY